LVSIESNTKITVYRVLQELLVNMKKHSQCSLVVLTFKKNENKLQIDYSDNGIGATIEELNLKNGLRNVENRIQAIKGTITFDSKSDKGFKVYITFPI
jgi:signal transduction histidine kinase